MQADGYLSPPSLKSISPATPLHSDDIAHQRHQSQLRLKRAWETIYEKYGRVFEDADEIDLSTGEIVVDRGWVRNIEPHVFGKAFYAVEGHEKKNVELREGTGGDQRSKQQDSPACTSVVVEASHRVAKRKRRSESSTLTESIARKKPRIVSTMPPATKNAQSPLVNSLAVDLPVSKKVGTVVRAGIFTVHAHEKAPDVEVYDDDAFDNILPQTSAIPRTPCPTSKPLQTNRKSLRNSTEPCSLAYRAINALATPLNKSKSGALLDTSLQALDLRPNFDLLTTPQQILEKQVSRLNLQRKVHTTGGRRRMVGTKRKMKVECRGNESVCNANKDNANNMNSKGRKCKHAEDAPLLDVEEDAEKVKHGGVENLGLTDEKQVMENRESGYRDTGLAPLETKKDECRGDHVQNAVLSSNAVNPTVLPAVREQTKPSPCEEPIWIKVSSKPKDQKPRPESIRKKPGPTGNCAEIWVHVSLDRARSTGASINRSSAQPIRSKSISSERAATNIEKNRSSEAGRSVKHPTNSSLSMGMSASSDQGEVILEKSICRTPMNASVLKGWETRVRRTRNATEVVIFPPSFRQLTRLSDGRRLLEYK